MPRQESEDFHGMLFGELAKRPRKSLDEQVFALGDEEAANGEGTADVGRSAAAAARDGADECGAAAPNAVTAGPGLNAVVGDFAVAPGGASEDGGKGVDRGPAVHGGSELRQVSRAEAGESRLVVADQLVGNKVGSAGVEQQQRRFDDDLGPGAGDLAGEFATNAAQRRSVCNGKAR